MAKIINKDESNLDVDSIPETVENLPLSSQPIFIRRTANGYL